MESAILAMAASRVKHRTSKATQTGTPSLSSCSAACSRCAFAIATHTWVASISLRPIRLLSLHGLYPHSDPRLRRLRSLMRPCRGHYWQDECHPQGENEYSPETSAYVCAQEYGLRSGHCTSLLFAMQIAIIFRCVLRYQCPTRIHYSNASWKRGKHHQIV